MPPAPRVNLTRLAMRIHSWSGLLGALVFVVVGLSGAVLVFHQELDAALFPRLFEVHPGDGELSYQRAIETAQRAFPEARVRGLRVPPPGEPRSLAIQAVGPRGGPALIALVDPYTGALRGTRIWGSGHTRFLEDPVSWTYLLHYQLTAGQVGQLVVVLASILLALSVLTGTFVYRKQLARAFTLREPLRRKSWAARFASLHRLVGAWTLVLNLVLAVSGLWMLRATFTADFWKRPDGRPAPTGPAPRSAHSYDEALAAARRALPGFEPSWMELRALPSDRFVILGRHTQETKLYGRYASAVVLDASNLGVLEVRRPETLPVGEKLNALAFPLHQGHWGGLPVKLLYVLAGIGVPMLSLTGTLLWLRRTRRRAQPATRPEPVPRPVPATGASKG
ncbi:PepSY domain-containing protein [Myxococcus sp. RHSTA-1-4]|uniref:PepSY-associated TM helix domain-containing protein n=1 Tax=Myxococcus sp. RHSTA-1-4 TaxID=2874601 RepID=UPI001CBF81F3|nr:PepSY-associated TM helix domain-containing protein [Myxococcus sp. RHSTA-1-4]MBZ4417949.1 PepSY domain-containing protein [Myxococcus sp. RHSTA-1-4]